MRFLVSCSLFAIAGFASASFDLILVSDLNNHCVHRYDGDTGTYLGSFGNNILVTPLSITVDQTLGIAYVGDDGVGLVAMNYNTGQVLWTNNGINLISDLAPLSNGGVMRTINQNLTSTAFQTFASPSTSSTATSYTNSVSSSWGTVGRDGAGDYLVQDRTSNRILRYNPAGFTAPELAGVTGSFVASSTGAVSSDRIISLTTSGAMVCASTQSATLVGSTGSLPTGSWTSVTEAAFGHANFAWGLGTNASGTRLQRYQRGVSNNTFSPIGTQIGLTQVGSATGMAVVVAPEPGSLLTLSLAALALRRKRTR
ncbi:MAG: hypothetical protein K8R88_08515 [Armatimonadetes bacterium]|nr:hypothetical protein [Armatimonadota bacterium]